MAATADLVVRVSRVAEPAHIFNHVCTLLGGTDPTWESKLFEEYLTDPWCKMPTHIKKRYGSKAVGRPVVELRENGATIATFEIESTKPTPTPAGYNAITSPTQMMPITPANMPKKKPV